MTSYHMQRTGQFAGGRLVAKVELLPGEYEVFTRPSRLHGRAGQLLFTNQRFIWRPKFRLKASERDMELIAHERVVSSSLVRPWQRLFLATAIRLKLRGSETMLFYMRHAEGVLPVIHDHLRRTRYKPGDLFS